MLYPLVVPLLLLSGENIITKNVLTGLSNQVCEVFFHNGSKTGVGVSNFTEFIYNKEKNGHVYKVNKCAFYGLSDMDLAQKGTKYALSNKVIDNATAERINNFLFLCLQYNLELKQKGMEGYDQNYIYKEMEDKLSDSDYILFWKAVRIAAYAADGAPEFLKMEDADCKTVYMDRVKEIASNAARGIRERRRLTSRPKGSVYFGNLISVLDRFFDSEHLPHTLIDLLKLTIIDPESLDVWSGKESSHFLDNIGDEMYTLAMAPEYFFAHSHGHEQYINNLRFVAVNPSETHFCYVDNQLGKYSDNIPEFITELLHFTYKELLADYDVDDSKRKLLVNARNYIGALTPSQSLDDNERPARRYLLMEMFIRLISAVLTNNWEDIELIPTRSFPELIQAADSFISRINISELNKFLHSESADDSVLTNALAMYEEAGRLITSNVSLLKWFDERYSKQFLALISSPQAQERLFAEESSYSYIFSLYRRWHSFKKAYIYTHYKSGFSLRSDITALKICNDYMKLYCENKSAVLSFAVVDNNGVSRRFRLRKAGIGDFDSVAQMNDQEFSRKIFVNSSHKELEFGLYATIWLVEEESTNTLAAFFIIVPIENDDRLAQMEGVYGTATLARKYAVENDCINKPFVIFDAVIVKNSYRGLGFQRLGMLLAEYLGKDISAEFICATVSPANIASSRNFQLLDYKKNRTVYYPSCDTLETPGRRYKEPTDYYINHALECDNEEISPEILSFLRENNISDEDYKQERVAVRDFVVLNLT